MKQQTRDEYLLHRTPNHTFPQYTTAHAMAGDLKLADEPAKKDKAAEQSTVLERVARGGKR